jgi:hypothetical protein
MRKLRFTNYKKVERDPQWVSHHGRDDQRGCHSILRDRHKTRTRIGLFMTEKEVKEEFYELCKEFPEIIDVEFEEVEDIEV